ncbi:MAG: hypothetical protein ACK5Y2_00435 [Bdellovibrionales bacterium]
MLKFSYFLAGLMASLVLSACDNNVDFAGRALDKLKAETPANPDDDDVPDEDVPPVIDQPPTPPVTPPPAPPVEPPAPPVEPPPPVQPPAPPVEPPAPPVEPPPPVQPPPPVVVPEPPALNLKSGTCGPTPGEALLSCLNCRSTPAQPAPPLLSRKAQELLTIMTAGCSVPNGSDPRGYKAPSREQILRRLVQCSPTLYPDTAFNGTQQRTVEALQKDPAAQRRAFSNLYYNSASYDFETYFGLEFSEARYTFCWDRWGVSQNGIYPKEYYDAVIEGQPYTLPARWVQANRIRQTLRNCLEESHLKPNPPQQPGQPGRSCRYESAEGEMSSRVIEKAQEWQSKGYEVFFEGFNMCGRLNSTEDLLNKTGFVKIATSICSNKE